MGPGVNTRNRLGFIPEYRLGYITGTGWGLYQNTAWGTYQEPAGVYTRNLGSFTILLGTRSPVNKTAWGRYQEPTGVYTRIPPGVHTRNRLGFIPGIFGFNTCKFWVVYHTVWYSIANL